MIGRLSGQLAEKTPPQILLDCHGVGYLVDVPMSSFYDLPDVGQQVTLLIHMVVREDAMVLYGFATAAERDAFRQLIRVNGVGPRTAMAVLSGMSVGELVQAVSAQETAPFTRVPGIGKKTAARLLLELKGKLGGELPTAEAVVGGVRSDILQALIALGYSEKEASRALQSVPAEMDVSDGIKHALQHLN